MMEREAGGRVSLFLGLLDRSITSGACAPVTLLLKRAIEPLIESVTIDLDAFIEGEVGI